jgi:hypothetical protein
VKWLLLMIMYLYCETIVVDDKVRLLIVDNVLTTIENVLEKLVLPVIWFSCLERKNTSKRNCAFIFVSFQG